MNWNRQPYGDFFGGQEPSQFMFQLIKTEKITQEELNIVFVVGVCNLQTWFTLDMGDLRNALLWLHLVVRKLMLITQVNGYFFENEFSNSPGVREKMRGVSFYFILFILTAVRGYVTEVKK